MKSTFRPYRSTTRVKTRSAPSFTAPSMTTPINTALLPKPADGAEHQRREEDEHDDAGELAEDGHGQGEHQVRAVLAPCRQPAERAVLALAREISLSSASTSAPGPRTWASVAWACTTRLLGVSVSKSAHP